MADFDTAVKRFSGMGLAGDDPPLLPSPDGTLGEADRLHLLDLYGGFAAVAAASGAPRIWPNLPLPYFFVTHG